MASSWAGLRGWVVADEIVEVFVICEDCGSWDEGIEDGTDELGVRDAL